MGLIRTRNSMLRAWDLPVLRPWSSQHAVHVQHCEMLLPHSGSVLCSCLCLVLKARESVPLTSHIAVVVWYTCKIISALWCLYWVYQRRQKKDWKTGVKLQVSIFGSYWWLVSACRDCWLIKGKVRVVLHCGAARGDAWTHRPYIDYTNIKV